MHPALVGEGPVDYGARCSNCDKTPLGMEVPPAHRKVWRVRDSGLVRHVGSVKSRHQVQGPGYGQKPPCRGSDAAKRPLRGGRLSNMPRPLLRPPQCDQGRGSSQQGGRIKGG